MEQLSSLKKQFESFLSQQIPEKNPKNLYAPLHYILANGGKRIRPLLVLLATQTFGEKIEKGMPAAAAIETFHNFTLIHDDIMDKAPIRRNLPTVHKKWNENIAILSGDTMLVWAYKMLEPYSSKIYKQLNVLLNQTAIEVCEGQQMDMDFENQENVSIESYLEMIRLKTAVLLGAALEFGGIVAQTTKENLKHINDFGTNLGLAFQIQDDYLDTFGDETSFGKQIGGDIIDRKKTFLYITALEIAGEQDKQKLIQLYRNQQINNNDLINEVIKIYQKYQLPDIAQKRINFYTKKALEALHLTDIPKQEMKFWEDFSYNLMNRKV